MDQQPSAAQNGGDQSQGVWDEARLKDSIQRLNLLQAKARALRDLIPRVLEPMGQKTETPKELYDVVMKGVADAQADITEFTKAMREEESKAIFARAVKSQQEAATDIKPWRHKDHPGWYDGSHQS